MSERTALEIAIDLDSASCSSFAKLEAAESLRQQHAEIERLKADAERVNSCAKNLAIAMHGQHFSHVTQWEPLPDTIGLITQIDNMSCWPDSEIERLTAERDEAVGAFRRLSAGQPIDVVVIADAIKRNDAMNSITIARLTVERDTAIATVAVERNAHAAEIDRLKRERQHIYDLLARIHRDGGQYTAESGVEKSCDDAEAQVVAWLDTINNVDALVEQARIAEREACAAACRRRSESAGLSGSASSGSLQCERDIRARSAK